MKRILCFGDSNTWGYTPVTGERYPAGVRWPTVLAEKYGCTVIEEGLNGRTSAFDDPTLPFAKGTDYIEACAVTHEPLDLLIIMLGTNDMKTYVCNCADASAKAVALIGRMARSAIQRNDLPVLMISPIEISEKRPFIEPPMRQINEESIKNTQKFAALFREQAELNGFFFMDAALYAKASDKDGVHMEPADHIRLGEAVAEKVREILG